MAALILMARFGCSSWSRTSSGRRHGIDAERFAALSWRRTAFALLALACAACNGEEDVTHSASACANEMFSAYNARVMEQCVAVCRRCERGTTVTCSTSCTLKGAR
jgi:hypothetical protein